MKCFGTAEENKKKPLRIPGNRADICIWDFLNTKWRLDRDAWSDVKYPITFCCLWRNTSPVPRDWWCNVVCSDDDEKRAITSVARKTWNTRRYPNVVADNFLIESVLVLFGIYRLCCRLNVNVVAKYLHIICFNFLRSRLFISWPSCSLVLFVKTVNYKTHRSIRNLILLCILLLTLYSYLGVMTW